MKKLLQVLKDQNIKHREYYTGTRFEFMEIFLGSNTIRITPVASQYLVEQKGDKPKKLKTEKEITKLLNISG